MDIVFYTLVVLACTAVVIFVPIRAFLSFRQKAGQAKQLENRLPDAVRLENLGQQIEEKQDRLNQIQTDLNVNGTELTDALDAIKHKVQAEQWLADNLPQLDRYKQDRIEQQALQQQVASLTEDLRAASDEKKQLTHDTTAIELQRDRAQQHLSALQQDLETTTSTLKETTNNAESLTERRSQLRVEVAQLDALADKQRTLNTEVVSLTEKDETLTKQVADKTRQHEHLMIDVADLAIKRDAAAAELKQLQTDIQQADATNSELKSRTADLTQLADQRETLHQQVSELQESQTKLTSELAQSRCNKDELIQANTNLSSKHEDLLSRVEEQLHTLESSKHTYETLRAESAEMTALIKRHESLSHKHDELIQRVDVLARQKMDLARDTDAAAQDKAQIDTRLAAVSAELDDVAATRDQIRDTVDTLREQRTTLVAEVAELEALTKKQDRIVTDVDQLQTRQHTLLEQVAVAQTEKAQLDTDLEQLREERTDVTETLSSRRAACDALQEQRAALKTQIAEFDEIAARQKTLRQEVDHLNNSRTQLQQANSTLEIEQARLNDTLEPLREELQTASASLDQARNTFNTLQQRESALKIEVAEFDAIAAKQAQVVAELETLTATRDDVSTALTKTRGQLSQTQQTLEPIQTELQVATQQLSTTTESLEQLQTQHKTLTLQVHNLDETAATHTALQQEIETFTQQQRELTAQITQQSADKHVLETQLAQLTQTELTTTTKLEAAQQAVDQLATSEATLKVTVADLEGLAAHRTELRDELKTLEKQHRESAATVTNYQLRKHRLEEEIKPLAKHLEAGTAKLDTIRTSVDELTGQQSALKRELADLESLNKRHQALKVEVETLATQQAEMSQHLTASTHQRQQLDDDLATVTTDLASRRQTLEQVTSQWNELRQREVALRTEVAELDALSTRCKSLRTEVTSLAQRQMELSKTVATDEARQSKLDEELLHVTATLQDKSASLKQTSESLESLQERRATVKAQVDDLDALSTKHQELTDQVYALTAQSKDLEQAVLVSQSQKHVLTQQLTQVDTDLTAKQELLEQTSSTHQSLTEQNAALRTEAAELDVLSKRHRDLDQEVRQMAKRQQDLDLQLSLADHTQEQKAENLGALEEELDTLKTKSEELAKTCESLWTRRNSLTTEVADLEQLTERHTQLTQDVEIMSTQSKQLHTELTSAQLRRTQTTEQVESLSQRLADQTDSLEKARTECEALSTQRSSLKTEVAELTGLSKSQRELKKTTEQLDQKRISLDQQVSTMTAKRDETAAAVEQLTTELTTQNKRYEQLRTSTESLQQQQAKLRTEVAEYTILSESRKQESDKIGGRLDRLVEDHGTKSEQLETTRSRFDELNEQVSGLSARREQLEQTVEVVNDTLKEMRLQAGYRGNNAGPLSELWKPALIKSEFKQPRKDDEQTCLQNTQQYLANLNLRFPMRTLNALHTSLKVSDISPLVVLAGISGTGKSELARRYAEGMGMHFLNLPVQPRWDSPQDMFGFFNYLENQYRATELARALVQMDPFANEDNRGWQTPEGWDHSLSNRMMIVLLDEMNLARVEYYFSEFLSRLEVRRGIDRNSLAARRKAEITLEVGMHGATDPTMRLFVDTNVLFVGTINEDETTQTLSDKVVDRSNVLAFGKPPRLSDMPRLMGNNAHTTPSKNFLPFDRWNSWVRKENELDPTAGTQINRWVEELNQAMEMIRRPYAFRTHMAMRGYAANYPDQSEQGLRNAMADQVEQKILPKFRGLDPNDEQVGRSLDMIVTLLDEWGDGSLINAIETARRDGTREHQFLFQGVDRNVETEALV